MKDSSRNRCNPPPSPINKISNSNKSKKDARFFILEKRIIRFHRNLLHKEKNFKFKSINNLNINT